MVDTSRRGIMRGAAGLGAVVATGGQGQDMARAARWDGLASGLNSARGLVHDALDPVFQAQQAAVTLAQQELDRKRAANRRAINSLSRLRSVSDAWRSSRIEHFEREDANLWDAFRLAQEKIFGGGQ